MNFFHVHTFNYKGSDPLEELELINQAKKGNKLALEMLIERNYPILKGYIIKMTYDSELSKDILQDTMLKAVININKFKPDSKFSTYLIRIATNIYRDILRKNKKYDLIDDDIPSNYSLEKNVLINEEYEKLVKILDSLPFNKKSAFILRYYYDYPYEEIGKILDIKLGTVKSRIHYCVSYIKENLKEVTHE